MTSLPDAIDLRVWITDLKTRGLSIYADGDGHLRFIDNSTGEIIRYKDEQPRDRDMKIAFHHALTIAAAGTHNVWWWAVLGAARQPQSFEEIPTSPFNPQAYACVTCGRPGQNLDQHLVSRCWTHLHEE